LAINVFANVAGELRYDQLIYLPHTLDSPAPFGLLPKLLKYHIRVEVVLVNERVMWALCYYVLADKRGFRKSLRLKVTMV
jgi:hypothetical protein